MAPGRGAAATAGRGPRAAGACALAKTADARRSGPYPARCSRAPGVGGARGAPGAFGGGFPIPAPPPRAFHRGHQRHLEVPPQKGLQTRWVCSSELVAAANRGARILGATLPPAGRPRELPWPWRLGRARVHPGATLGGCFRSFSLKLQESVHRQRVFCGFLCIFKFGCECNYPSFALMYIAAFTCRTWLS